jgi:hypothetical protein
MEREGKENMPGRPGSRGVPDTHTPPHTERLAAIRIPLAKRWVPGNPRQTVGVWQPSPNGGRLATLAKRWGSGNLGV